MNKFNRPPTFKTNSVNRNIFAVLPEVKPVIVEAKEEVKPEIIEEQKPIITPEISQSKIDADQEEDTIHLSFAEVYSHNVEIIPEKGELKIKRMPSMKLIVDEVLLNMRKQKINGWQTN